MSLATPSGLVAGGGAAPKAWGNPQGCPDFFGFFHAKKLSYAQAWKEARSFSF
jgi:hypothetical protein